MERPAPSLAGIAPPALDHVLQTCLAKDPEERWQSVRDLKRELEWIAAAPAEPEATKPEPRGLRFWLLRVTVLLAAAALGTGWLLSHLRPPESTGAPRLKLILAPPSEEGASYLVLSPDGTRMAFSTPKGLYVRSADSTEAQRIAAAGGPQPGLRTAVSY